MQPLAGRTVIDIHKKAHQTAGNTTRWSGALTKIMRIDDTASLSSQTVLLSKSASALLLRLPLKPLTEAQDRVCVCLIPAVYNGC